MNTEATNEIVEDLKNTAASLVQKDTVELQEMKSKLDLYSEDITSKMPEKSQSLMNKEFEKCRVCAREWISVYNDAEYNPAVKEDILKEEVMEFFFTMNEKIVSVQKNFFLLGMVDELLAPGKPFSDQQRIAKIAKSRIRILAREQGVNATYKGESAHRLWFFGDETNFLQSSEEGLNDEQALDYLLD